MKILIIVPIIYNKEIDIELKEELQQIKNTLKEVQLEVDTVFTESGVSSIESEFDDTIASFEVLKTYNNSVIENYHAVVIDCFLGPGVKAVRELSKIPIIDPGESAIFTAMAIGQSFTLVNILLETEAAIRRKIQELGVSEHLTAVRNVNIPVLDLFKNRASLIKEITRIAEKDITEHNTGAIVLGCTGMMGVAKDVEKKLNKKDIYVPVIDPFLASIYWALYLVYSGYSYSKVKYPHPREKTRKL